MSKKNTENDLVIRNKTVIEFYKQYSYLDFEQVNLLLVNFLSNIIQEADNGISKGLSTQILQQCSENSLKMDMMSSELSLRMIDLKKEYLEDLKKENVYNVIKEYDFFYDLEDKEGKKYMGYNKNI